MEWIPLDNSISLAEILIQSHKQPVVIFKHSTRCSISAMVLNRLNKLDAFTLQKPTKYYYLDILNFRAISNEIAEQMNIIHESPQILIIFQGKTIFNASHNNITSEIVNKIISEA
ncbi:MAG: bacillithiol system redox-active protein YtxJ [Bacteroidota bacterium]|nr:bacillithiol system redox-active protein YtxJ [Bacteroidota bacterium]